MNAPTQATSTPPLLKGKVAVIYGAYGAVGAAVAKAFASSGAKVHVTGRDAEKAASLAKEIAALGGKAEHARVDALDANAVEEHLQHVMDVDGRVDVSFNAVGLRQDKTPYQGTPIAELTESAFMEPITTYTRSHFVTARAAAKRMIQAKAGVILLHTPETPAMGIAHMGGMTSAWAGIEALARGLSAEVAPHGARTVILRTTGLPETKVIHDVVALHAKAVGVSVQEFWGFTQIGPHTRRSTTLRELSDAAVLAASDLGKGLTGGVLNLTAGKTLV